MSFWEHVEELAKRLKVALYTFIISTIAMMILPANLTSLADIFNAYEPLVSVLLRKIKNYVLPEGMKLIGLEITAPFEIYLYTSVLLGISITTPVTIYEILKFIEPALYPHERRATLSYLTTFSLLYICGLLFGFIVVTPIVIKALIPFFQIAGAEPIISVKDFYTLIFVIPMLTGLTFTSPIFVVLLVKYGIIKTSTLKKYRGYWYLLWFIIVAIITPDGALANLVLFIPIIALFEASIHFAKRYEYKNVLQYERNFLEGVRCKYCNKIISQDTVFCPYCGKSQK
jgi:sec-independent protein translocase protein TatC